MEKIAAGKEKPTGAAVIETDFRNPVLSRNVCRYIDENHSDFRITREAKPKLIAKGGDVSIILHELWPNDTHHFTND